MHQIRTRVSLVLAALSLAAIAVGCGDDPPADPVSELRFFHSAPTLGNIDIAVDDKTLEVALGELSGTLRTDPGAVEITVSNAGAAQSLFSVSKTLDEGSHVFVVSGSAADDTLSAFEVGLNPPDLEEGDAAFQVVNVRTVTQAVDVYFDAEGGVPTQIDREGQTGFQTAPPADAEVLIYNAGASIEDTPILYIRSDDLDLRAGGVYTILVSGDRLNPGFTVTQLE